MKSRVKAVSFTVAVDPIEPDIKWCTCEVTTSIGLYYVTVYYRKGLAPHALTVTKAGQLRTPSQYSRIAREVRMSAEDWVKDSLEV